MLFTILSVFYVLIAAAMIVLILIQRGDGANAGASFGGGASGAMFGSRGSASVLTRITGALAAVFFVLTLGMGIYLSHHGVVASPEQTLGVMAGAGASGPAAAVPASAVPATSTPAAATQPGAVPQAAGTGNAEVPAATAKAAATSAPTASAPSASH